MNEKLLEKLGKWWPGRRALQKAFESRGFMMHREYQDELFQFCGENQKETVERYWEEYAREFHCSQVFVEERKFVIQNYRSAFLDELASKIDLSKSPLKYGPLLPCLHEYHRAIYEHRIDYRPKSKLFEQIKIKEINEFGISIEGWSNKRSNVKKIVASMLKARGYRAKGNRFSKETRMGVVLECWFDAGGNPQIFRLPVDFFVCDEESPEVLKVVNFEILIPGFHIYRLWESPSSAMLGLNAYLEMLDVLFVSLNSG